VIEYVRTGPDVADGFERHLNHLLMGLASATAFSAFLKIDFPVFGFLIDRTHVLVYLAWVAGRSDTDPGTAISQDMPDAPGPPGMSYKLLLDLDIGKNPLDVLRLRLMAKNVLDYGCKIRAAYDESTPKVIKELEDGTFCRWRQKGVMQSLQEQSDEVPPSIEGWIEGLLGSQGSLIQNESY